MAYLYALCDESGVCRYIGSSRDPWKRYGTHVSRFAALAVREWVAELKERGAAPVLCVLGEVSDERRLEAEADLIRCIGRHATLLNAGVERPRRTPPRPSTSEGLLALREAMRERGISQRELTLILGASAPTVSRLVRGHLGPGRTLARAIHVAFGIDPGLWDKPARKAAA